LYNTLGRRELKLRLERETFGRKTISFYRYFEIADPKAYRDDLFRRWDALQCLGRIYVAREGINAQMSVPEHHMEAFLAELDETAGLEDMPIKYAIEDDGKSFYKLTIKVREKIVADGFAHDAYDFTNVGTHLSALEFHTLAADSETLVVDMRNHYEYEVGRFRRAVHPEAQTFREAITRAAGQLEGQEDKKILLYCTGGIRCEKASAYLKSRGFKDVNQLHGGIIEYARQIREMDLDSEFTGKNFVFDHRLGESVDGAVIARCHQCGIPCDTHTNCAYQPCHTLIIQCSECSEAYDGCCSEECHASLQHQSTHKTEVNS